MLLELVSSEVEHVVVAAAEPSRPVVHAMDMVVLADPPLAVAHLPAAVVLCRADVARRYSSNPVQLRADVFRTRNYGSFETLSPSMPVKDAPSPSVQASQAAVLYFP